MMNGTTGGQTMSCPECGGMMELRLGRWDCARCGHVIEPDKPVEIDVGSPADTVKRARLITRPEAAVPESGDAQRLEGRLHLLRQTRTDSLAVRLACIFGQLLVMLASHAYVFEQGHVAAWIGTGTIITRVLIQLVYGTVVCVGLIWRELPTKYLAIGLQIPVFIGLLMMTMVRYGLVGQPDFTRHALIPEMNGWYWAMLLLMHTALMFAVIGVLHRDLEARVSPADRA